MRRSTALLLAGLAVSLVACGSTTSSSSSSTAPPSSDAKAVITTATSLLSSTPVTIDGHISLSVVNAPPQLKQLSKKPLDLKLHAELATFSNATASLQGSVGDQTVNIQLAVSGGAQYVSLNGGTSWKKQTALTGTALNFEAVIEYLAAVSSVSDAGDGKYQVLLDTTILKPFLQSSLAATEPLYSSWTGALSGLTPNSASLNVTVAGKRFTNYQGGVNISLDSKKLDPAAIPPLQMRETVSFTFSKYGTAAPTVTPPPAS